MTDTTPAETPTPPAPPDWLTGPIAFMERVADICATPGGRADLRTGTTRNGLAEPWRMLPHLIAYIPRQNRRSETAYLAIAAMCAAQADNPTLKGTTRTGGHDPAQGNLGTTLAHAVRLGVLHQEFATERLQHLARQNTLDGLLRHLRPLIDRLAGENLPLSWPLLLSDVPVADLPHRHRPGLDAHLLRPHKPQPRIRLPGEPDVSVFIGINVLHPFPLSNLNRNDLNSPKVAMYGGVERSRVSSQSTKRTTRHKTEEVLGDKALRTRRVPAQVAAELQARGWDEEEVVKAGQAVALASGVRGLAIADAGTTTVMLYLPEAGISALADLVEKNRDTIAKAAAHAEAEAAADKPGSKTKAPKLDKETAADVKAVTQELPRGRHPLRQEGLLLPRHSHGRSNPTLASPLSGLTLSASTPGRTAAARRARPRDRHPRSTAAARPSRPQPPRLRAQPSSRSAMDD